MTILTRSPTGSVGPTTMSPSSKIVELYHRLRPQLLGYVKQQLADTAQAEDIVQEVFMELVNAYQLPLEIEQAGAWLYRVARHRIIDWRRKKKTISQVDLNSDASTAEGENPLEAAMDVNSTWLDTVQLPHSPEAAYIRAQMMQQIQVAIASLPEAQRQVFVAHELEGKSFKEIAEQTGVPINTLLARKRYAVLQLRLILQDLYEQL